MGASIESFERLSVSTVFTLTLSLPVMVVSALFLPLVSLNGFTIVSRRAVSIA